MESVTLIEAIVVTLAPIMGANNGPRSDYVGGGDDGVITGGGNRSINESSDFIDDDSDGYFLGDRKNKTISSWGNGKGGAF